MAASKVRAIRMSIGRSIITICVTIFVIALIVASFWVAVDAVRQKINLVRGTGQVIDIVDLTRRVAATERNFGATDHEDVLARLSQLEQVKTVKDDGSEQKIINPWGGALVAYAVPGNLFRIEDTLSPLACDRMIGVLTKDINSLGLREINTRSEGQSWRQIYLAKENGSLQSNQIAAGCNSRTRVTLALTFILR